ncbi:MAG: chorismate-binding protein, partial [Spirochaetia bacterium]
MNAPRPDSFPAQNSVLLETLKFDALNSRSLLFTNPQTILSTSDIGEVDVLLSSLDDYVSRGFYAAGFLAFEAGYAFVPALGKRLHGRQPPFPLLWFGIYNAPRIWDPRLERAPYINRPLVPNDGFRGPNRPQKQPSFDDYRKKIDNIKEYIRRGHTYQINFTWNTDIPFSGPAFGLYNQIKHIQPVSYAGYLDCGD